VPLARYSPRRLWYHLPLINDSVGHCNALHVVHHNTRLPTDAAAANDNASQQLQVRASMFCRGVHQIWAGWVSMGDHLRVSLELAMPVGSAQICLS
jgi:hypothetical protein